MGETDRYRTALETLAWDAITNSVCIHARENSDPMTGECLHCCRSGHCPLFSIIDDLDLSHQFPNSSCPMCDEDLRLSDDELTMSCDECGYDDNAPAPPAGTP